MKLFSGRIHADDCLLSTSGLFFNDNCQKVDIFLLVALFTHFKKFNFLELYTLKMSYVLVYLAHANVSDIAR